MASVLQTIVNVLEDSQSEGCFYQQDVESEFGGCGGGANFVPTNKSLAGQTLFYLCVHVVTGAHIVYIR